MTEFGGYRLGKRKDQWGNEETHVKTTSFPGVGTGGEFDFFGDEERLDVDDVGFDPTSVFVPKTEKKLGVRPEGKPISVQHEMPVKLAPVFATDSEVRRDNFLRNYGVTLTNADELDLDDTSCEEEEREGKKCTFCKTAKFEEDDHSHCAVKRAKTTVLPDDVSVSSTTSCSSYNPLKGSNQLYEKSESSGKLPEDDDDEDDDGSDDDRPGGSSQAEECDEDDSQSLVHGGLAPKAVCSPAASAKMQCTCSKTGGHSSAGRMNNCFLCRWGNKSADAVENSHMKTLMMILDRHIGDIAPKFIALVMHAYYRKIMMPAAAAANRFLPVWRSKQIFICITTHNYRPEMRLIHDIETLTTLEASLQATLYKKDAEGNIEPSLPTAKRLLEVMKMKWSLYGLPLSKLNFNSGTDQTTKLFGGNNPRYKSIQMVPDRKRISALPGQRQAS
jgi:hypothetical protein